MEWITAPWRWARSMARSHALQRRLDDEIQFHIDQQVEKNQRAGMMSDEARRQALIKFGGVEHIKERTRDEIRPRLVEDSIRDVRYGVRMLRHNPFFAATAVVMLALGIGASTTLFSIVHAVLLQ